MSRGTTFSTRLQVRPLKTRISLRSLKRVFSVRIKTLWILGYPQSVLQ